MPEVTFTNNKGRADFQERRTATLEAVSSDKDTPPSVLPAASSWFLFLSEGSLQDVRRNAQSLIGVTETANVTEPIEITLKWLTEKGVKIENPANVRSYLLRYSDLVTIIPQIWGRASTLLLPSTQFSLALYCDRELPEEYLTLYARQKEYQKNILDVTFEVNAECESLLSGRSGFLLTTTDFRSPK